MYADARVQRALAARKPFGKGPIPANAPKLDAHPILGWIGFRPRDDKELDGDTPYELDAHLCYTKKAWGRDTPRARPEAHDYLLYHPLVLRSFLTTTPILRLAVHTIWDSAQDPYFELKRPIVVADILKLIHEK